jgi:hypothetical protein
MPKVLLTALLIYLLSLPLACSNSQEVVQSETPRVFDEAKETAAVYSVAIRRALADRFGGNGLYISSNSISLTTNTWGVPQGNFDERLDALKKRHESVDHEVLNSFLTKYQKPFKFGDELNLDLPARYSIIDGDLVEQELKKSVLGGPPSKLPGAILRLSRLGFNAAYDQAFLQMDFVGCAKCGFGSAYSLEKKDGIWKIKEHFEHWVS